MRFIFPQFIGLGYSATARYYAIRDINEVKAFIDNEILKNNLIEISKALLELESNDAFVVMGAPDNMKLQSSMTLFALAKPEYSVFQSVLDKFFNGERDQKTLEILAKL
ncbi:DUF1810 domain-containing protein [[Clostridium] saccharogumia]|uniref:DUF1810 family protein n=1 Tax=Thomasclavelia saccharogumia TaxID=341225 RepID=UPI001D08BF83|nr:DUF1810 domain-containing protein [Thomasclavelia saccharogumia]